MLRRRAATATVVLALTLTACTGGDDEPEPGPDTSDVEVPEGVTLTSAGSTVPLGESASVVYQPQNAAQTVVTISVDKITRGKPKDLAGYDLRGTPEGSVPYYVRASVRNAGPAVLAGGAVPLYGLDSGNSYFKPVEMRDSVGGCKPLRLDDHVKPGAVREGCLVFTVPPKRTFKGVQVRTSDLNRPVSWKP
ncbi:MAG TPA: hypothetical protein VK059_10040 [Nocardioidaceae bacterium]|nr:hypothetical protein [Nocardioidaceae bacterium]